MACLPAVKLYAAQTWFVVNAIPGNIGVDSLYDANTGSAQRFYRIGVQLP